MAAFTKTHPTLANRSRAFLGKTLDMYTVDLAVNATDFSATEMGAEGAVQAMLRTFANAGCTIVGHSELRADGGANAGQVMDVYVEGDFPTDTYDGTNSETFAAWVQSEIRLLTAVGAGPVNLNAATVARGTGFPLFANVA